MKPKNFPQRKLIRQAKAQGKELDKADLQLARDRRTKKDRSHKAKIFNR